MREIKFRAWDNENNKMIDPFLYAKENGRFIGLITDSDDLTPMQYTGLKDKNGKEIYEGDIMDYGLGRTFYISFVGGSFVATFNERVINTMIPFYNYSAIGNIYETPHLIKIKEKMD
jgi:hypothetical protein